MFIVSIVLHNVYSILYFGSMWFLFYPQLYTLFYVVIILCCILYYPLLCSCDDVYAEYPVFPQKWGMNEKKN